MVASSPLEPSGAAAILARKAAEDATAVREFAANPEIADGIIGFHAQQAIEKWLKAVLSSRSVDFEYTHDLSYPHPPADISYPRRSGSRQPRRPGTCAEGGRQRVYSFRD